MSSGLTKDSAEPGSPSLVAVADTRDGQVEAVERPVKVWYQKSQLTYTMIKRALNGHQSPFGIQVENFDPSPYFVKCPPLLGSVTTLCPRGPVMIIWNWSCYQVYLVYNLEKYCSQ